MEFEMAIGQNLLFFVCFETPYTPSAGTRNHHASDADVSETEPKYLMVMFSDNTSSQVFNGYELDASPQRWTERRESEDLSRR